MEPSATKLLLIMPPQGGLLNGFAAGLIALANYVRAELPHVEAAILDLSKTPTDDAKEAVTAACHPGKSQNIFVGITTTTASYQAGLAMAQAARDAAPNAVILFGGSHASGDPEVVLRHHEDLVDLVVIGEGERALCELIQCYPERERIHGAAFLRDGEYRANPRPVPLSPAELDAIPLTYKDNGLIGTPGKFGHVTYVSARGCPLPCAFCAVGNAAIRAKSVDAVTRDIEQLLDMGFSSIAIEDNFFAHSSSRTRALCLALKDLRQRRGSTFTWDCQTRVESLVRPGTIQLMAEAGCEAVYVGVESFHPEHLLYLKKTPHPATYLAQLNDVIVPSLCAAGIACYMNLQLGLPHETVDHERHTLAVLTALGQQAQRHGTSVTIFPQLHVVYPGTLHCKQGVDAGRFPADVFETFTKWESEHAPILFWLGEHFAHGTGGIPLGILKPDQLRRGEYEVDTDAVLHISGALGAIAGVPGVKVFHYGNHIVGDLATLSPIHNRVTKKGISQ